MNYSKRDILLVEELTLFNFILHMFFLNCDISRNYIRTSGMLTSLGRIPIISSIIENNFKKLEYADFPGSYFTAENEGYETVVDTIFEKNEDNIYVKIARSFCINDLYKLALKKEIYMRYSQKRVKSFTILKYLSAENPEKTIIFEPCDDEQFVHFLSSDFFSTPNYLIPLWVILANKILGKIKEIIFLLLFPLFLIFISCIFLRRGIDRCSDKQQYDFGLDIFNSGINFGKNPYEFYFLFDNKQFHPKEILHVIRNKFGPDKNCQKTREHFEKLGYPYIEHDGIPVPIGIFVEKILRGFFVGGIISYIKFLFRSNWCAEYAAPALAVMKMTLDSEIFYNKYDVKVFIARDEYSSYHIVRTLVARNHGNVTVGFSHGDDCHHTSALNYLVFDKYAVWGEFYSQHLKKSLQYSDVFVMGAGIYGLDKTFHLESHHIIPIKYRLLKNEFKFIGIIASSFDPELYITKEGTLHFYKTVLDLTEKYPGYYRIIKPKGSEFLDPDFQNLLRGYERVIIEDSIWTYRLLASLDVLICINVTSLGLEGLMANKKVFYYDVTNNRNHHVYSRYSSDIVAFDEISLKHNLNRYFNEGKYLSPEMIQKIQKYHGLTYDGNVVGRFRQCCLRLLKETETKKNN